VGNGNMLDIVMYKNSWLSEVIFSDILDSDHIPVVFHLLHHISTRNLLDPADKFTDWKWFQSLASEFYLESKLIWGRSR
jgi:hypothetical protein